MSDVHPSPSASTGREILKSTFIQPQDPAEHYIECAQCGYIKNLDKAVEGDAMETDSTAQESGVHQQGISVTGLYTKVSSLPQALQSVQANYIGTFSHIEPVVTSGCPFCGSLNSRGIGRDSDPFIANVRDYRNAWP
jgi:hypothetical protein